MAVGKYQKLDLKPTEFPKLSYTYRKLTPMRSLVHVQLDRAPDIIEIEDREPIVLSGAYKARCQLCQGKILSVGPQVKDVAVGDVVLIEQHQGSGNDGRVRKDGTMLIERTHVLCVVEV